MRSKGSMLACCHQQVYALSALLAFVLVTLPYEAESSTFGLGIDRLRQFGGHKNGHLNGGLHNALDNSVDEDEIVEEYFGGAVVDNFAPREEQQFWHSGQRYFYNTKWWGGNGSPIFLMIGGEGPENKKSVSEKWYFYQLAEEHKALLVCVEHRFYGKSYPTVDMSTANLHLLTSAQALADLARFTHFFKDKMKASDSQFIAFGGSYPGNLAAWFRLKYPHLVSGSVASSAPVLAKTDFFEYMDVVGQAIRYFGGDECYDVLKAGVEATAQLVADKQVWALRKDFELCGNGITSEKDLWVFETNVMGNFQGTVQYNAERPGDMTVSSICEVLTNGTDAYAQFLELNRKYLDAAGQSCMDVSWVKSLSDLRSTEFDGESASRQWYFQTCNEFGYYQTVSGTEHPFGPFKTITLQSYLDLCEEVFGIDMPPPTQWTIDFYGGLDIDATRVIFPSGTIDPWHALGVQNTTDLANEMESPLYILGTAHCADMHSPAVNDPPSLTYARAVVAKYVASWVSTPGLAKTVHHDMSTASSTSSSPSIAFHDVAGTLRLGHGILPTLLSSSWSPSDGAKPVSGRVVVTALSILGGVALILITIVAVIRRRARRRRQARQALLGDSLLDI